MLFDLKKFLKEENEKDRAVVLMIDANERIDNRKDVMIEVTNEVKLTDVHAKVDPLNGGRDLHSRDAKNRLCVRDGKSRGMR